MQAHRKGSIDFAALLLVIGIATSLLLIMQIPLFSKMFAIKKNIDVYVNIDDRGSEIASLLNSRRNGIDTEEALGVLMTEPNSDSKERIMVKQVMDKIYGRYRLVLNGPYGSLVIRNGKVAGKTRNSGNCGIVVNDRGISLNLPLRGDVKISSGFGYRERPKGVCDCHSGIDFSVPEGTPVYAVADGRVWRVAYNEGGYGKYVVLKHDFGGKVYYTIYADLSDVGVKEGEYMKGGDEVGLSGNSGSGEYHLHFEVRRDVNGNFGIADRDSVNPCPLFVKEPEGCVHEPVDVCNVAYEKEGEEAIDLVEADIPLPGAVEGKLRGKVEMIR